MVSFLNRHVVAVALLVTLSVGLTACSPTFNWREMRLEGASLVALMPCKPETASRDVPLLGVATGLHMHSCKAGDLTFAVAWAELPAGGRAEEGLAQWRDATLATVRAVPGGATDETWLPVVVGGSQAQLAIKAVGGDHQGQALQVQALFFSQGRRLYQAAIYGQDIDGAVSASFFEGLSLP